MIVKYINSSMESVELNGAGIKLRDANFFRKIWTPEKNNKRYNYIKEPLEYKMIIEVVGTFKFKRETLDKIFEVTEKDLISSKTGRLFFNDWYLNCNITESKTYPSESPIGMISEMIVFAEDAIWIKESTKQFFPQSSVDVSDGLDYDFDYEFDYAPEQAGVERWYIDHYASSDFNMIIYGPCVDPKILINGYPHQIYTDLEESDYLIIDSRKHEITKHMANGTTANLYNSRSFEHSVFEKIPCGDVVFNWPGNFGFDVTLFLERSEPEFGSGSTYIETETGKYMITE